MTGRNGIDADALWHQFCGKFTSKGHNCRFGGGIDGEIGYTTRGVNGGKVENGSAAALVHPAHSLLGAEVVAADVDVVDLIKQFG
jgi:hypothetical protein